MNRNFLDVQDGDIEYIASPLWAPIGIVLDALPKLFGILSTELQGRCFYY